MTALTEKHRVTFECDDSCCNHYFFLGPDGDRNMPDDDYMVSGKAMEAMEEALRSAEFYMIEHGIKLPNPVRKKISEALGENADVEAPPSEGGHTQQKGETR